MGVGVGSRYGDDMTAPATEPLLGVLAIDVYASAAGSAL